MALREFSRKLRISERGSNINLQYSFENTVRRLEISAEASTLLQRRILLPETRNIQLRASGGGVGLVQIGYDFNVAVNGAWPSFVVNPLVFKATEPNQLKVSVCTNYIQEGSGSTSNMAVMEVTLPSGFTIDKDSLPALRRYKGVKRVDSMSGDTKVIIARILPFQTKKPHPSCCRWCYISKALVGQKFVLRYLPTERIESSSRNQHTFWFMITMIRVEELDLFTKLIRVLNVTLEMTVTLKIVEIDQRS